MARLIAAIVLTVMVVAFAVANAHHVELSFVFGAPVRVRLTFLLTTAFLLGMLTNTLLRLVAQTRRRSPIVPPPPEST